MLWLYTQSPHKVSIDYTLLKLSVHQMFAQSLQDSESQLHVSNMWFSRKPSKITESCKKVQLGAQFCLIYLLLFSTCFGHPFAPHQEKITVSMRHSCLSLCHFFVRYKANAGVKLAKMGHGPHSSKLVVICVVLLLFVLFYVILYFCCSIICV
jgi:hypothetical protein